MREKYNFIKKEFVSFLDDTSSYIDEIFENCKGKNVISNFNRLYEFLAYSALMFFLLASQIPFRTRHILGVIVAFFMIREIIKRTKNIAAFINLGSNINKVFYLLTSLGIVFENQKLFYEAYLQKDCFSDFDYSIYMINELIYIIAFLMALLSLPFIYLCIEIFFEALKKSFNLNKFFSQMTKIEGMLYGLLYLGTVFFMSEVFGCTNAFYSCGINYDVIYTSDTTKIFYDNAYLSIFHNQNDLRQPLFAIFSAPFLGASYFVSQVFSFSEALRAVIVNSIQIFVLLFANLMVVRLLNWQVLYRICFMMFITCSYMYMLFSLMMEQYIFAYFWLIFFIYLYKINETVDRLAFWGAGSTLLTSFVIFPIVQKAYNKLNLKTYYLYLKDFIFILLLFGRADVIVGSVKSVLFFMNFSGKGVPFIDRVYQYMSFIQSCFVAPKHSVDFITMGHVSWQLERINSFSIVGILLLLVIAISAIINRENKIGNIAFAWVVFSAAMLCILGWGTKENGLILYSLYFGWAFMLLVCLFLEKIENCLGIKYLLPVVLLIAAFGMLRWNIASIIEVINFAVTYYPA